ncbi:hypothetical protein L596_015581 [Steinernema carpocapsae]|uniref:Uncharacterized protein n=1 Tax=Steinernema carpocapsae TaxID=34508 RepID=A0A4U5NFK3_STECR|nr:hypothetical protein L596_015581 [Steinernema carpocapsae]
MKEYISGNIFRQHAIPISLSKAVFNVFTQCIFNLFHLINLHKRNFKNVVKQSKKSKNVVKVNGTTTCYCVISIRKLKSHKKKNHFLSLATYQCYHFTWFLGIFKSGLSPL